MIIRLRGQAVVFCVLTVCVVFSGCGMGLCLIGVDSSIREERSGSASLATNCTLPWPVSACQLSLPSYRIRLEVLNMGLKVFNSNVHWNMKVTGCSFTQELKSKLILQVCRVQCLLFYPLTSVEEVYGPLQIGKPLQLLGSQNTLRIPWINYKNYSWQTKNSYCFFSSIPGHLFVGLPNFSSNKNNSH